MRLTSLPSTPGLSRCQLEPRRIAQHIVGLNTYTNKGEVAKLGAIGEVTPEIEARGVRPTMLPLPAWEVIPPGDIFRVFERGGRNIVTRFPEVGLPNSTRLIQRLEEPGRPD